MRIDRILHGHYFEYQVLCLEAGTLILSQPPSSILLGQPLFSITNFTNVSLWLYNIAGLEGKSFVSGYGTYVLSNEYINRTTHSITEVTHINITTEFPEAWADFRRRVWAEVQKLPGCSAIY